MSWVLVYKSKQDSLPALKAPVQQPRWVGAGSLGLRWGPFPKRVMSELVMSSPGRGAGAGEEEGRPKWQEPGCPCPGRGGEVRARARNGVSCCGLGQGGGTGGR